MRIGFNGRVLADPHVRGWTRYTAELLRALSRADGVELVVFSREEPHPDHLRGVRARVIVADAAREAMWDDWVLPRMLRREGVALFHAPADRGLPAWKPCPLVVTAHNSYERAHWRSLFHGVKRRAWYWKHELVNYCLADAVLTVSDTTREELIRLRVVRPERVHRVYLAPAPEFQPTAQPSDTAVLERLCVTPPYVLYVGGFDAHKNVELLGRAFTLAHLPLHQLVVVARQRQGDRALIERWRAHACAVRLRLIECDPGELPALYRHADLFVNPSRWESFGLQLLEAMACGAPLLVSNRTALPEVAGGAAVLFDPDDASQLARVMERVACDPALRRALRVAGFDRVRQFSWHATAEETLRVYRAVLANAGKPVPELREGSADRAAGGMR